ncbi:Ku protein [Saccharopolyspora griseoalba]|uniref:Non-homologous end joining protein Ku n=1 Tax=Saccharopolyspora griseoalba TaxID=1431848 RepID=A0ABW2LS99_9PSEU
MATAVWGGVLSVGLVTLPVELFSATEDHAIAFHQYERGTADRIRYRRINERTGRDVDLAGIVKGRPVGAQVVTVEDSELDEIAPGRSRSIMINRFVDVTEINPVHFERTYWLAPGSVDHRHAYNLLHRAMTMTGRAAIATFVLRGKQRLAMIRADEHVLALTTLRWPAEIRDPATVLDIPSAAAEPSPSELQAATTVITAMHSTWTPEEYEDTYTTRVKQLLEAKEHGQAAPIAPAEAPEPTPATELEQVLRASVESAKKRRANVDR